MPIPILMPALSPTMEKGKLAKWLVKEGDAVAPGDVIAEIETDKATMEVEAVDDGTMGRLVVAEGTDDVPVNETIAVLLSEGEDASAISGDTPPPAKKADKAEAAAPEPEKAEDTGADTAKPEADDAAGGNDNEPKLAEAKAADGKRIFATPLARRLAKEAGIELSSIKGSGPRGRIVKADIDSGSKADGTQKSGSGTPAPAPQTVMAGGPADSVVRQLFKDGSFTELAHDGMRKTIASRLTESHQTIPSYFLSVDCELDKLLAVRADVNEAAPKGEDGKPQWKVSVNDFIIKALALALRDVPAANASWTSTARLMHKHSDIGVAVAIPDGLITPIVRQAELKPLSAISNEVKDMAARARDRKLKPQEYQGGTTAVSNLGMFGVSNFTSIINPPHASIVSIGAGEKKPVVRGDELAIATVMTATFAFDHRVIDGALGAELAQAFKSHVERPMGMLV